MGLNRMIRIISCLVFSAVMVGLTACTLPTTAVSRPVETAGPGASTPAEIEATEFIGLPLTPLVQQNNNALKGTQFIDKETYRLVVDGLVEKPLSLSYADLLAYPQVSRYMELDCVDGWNFAAKWSGTELNAIFNDAGVKPGAVIAIFYTAEVPQGYTSLELSYIREKNIIIAFKNNDITLPPERGFPFQVAAENKFGYKWAKWVTRIELSADTQFRGYWEKRHYNNDASINGPRGEP
jgi:DMSO/TMAO reductase YedYZ molybdopterin-dependent catalytic subunit